VPRRSAARPAGNKAIQVIVTGHGGWRKVAIAVAVALLGAALGDDVGGSNHLYGEPRDFFDANANHRFDEVFLGLHRGKGEKGALVVVRGVILPSVGEWVQHASTPCENEETTNESRALWMHTIMTVIFLPAAPPSIVPGPYRASNVGINRPSTHCMNISLFIML